MPRFMSYLIVMYNVMSFMLALEATMFVTFSQPLTELPLPTPPLSASYSSSIHKHRVRRLPSPVLFMNAIERLNESVSPLGACFN